MIRSAIAAFVVALLAPLGVGFTTSAAEARTDDGSTCNSPGYNAFCNTSRYQRAGKSWFTSDGKICWRFRNVSSEAVRVAMDLPGSRGTLTSTAAESSDKRCRQAPGNRAFKVVLRARTGSYYDQPIGVRTMALHKADRTVTLRQNPTRANNSTFKECVKNTTGHPAVLNAASKGSWKKASKLIQPGKVGCVSMRLEVTSNQWNWQVKTVWAWRTNKGSNYRGVDAYGVMAFAT